MWENEENKTPCVTFHKRGIPFLQTDKLKLPKFDGQSGACEIDSSKQWRQQIDGLMKKRNGIDLVLNLYGEH